jgi:glyoxylase-like metal-dependent hydrolase (beta-lactamase superfamily II)
MIALEFVEPGISFIRARERVGRIANGYLLEGKSGNLLVEPCIGDHAHGAEWLTLIASGILPPIAGVFITHSHDDHTRGVFHIAWHLGKPFLGPDTHRDGDILCGWHVLATPGHDPKHLCLWRDDGVVVVGDAMTDQRSAEQIVRLTPRLILPGHGEVLRLSST